MFNSGYMKISAGNYKTLPLKIWVKFRNLDLQGWRQVYYHNTNMRSSKKMHQSLKLVPVIYVDIKVTGSGHLMASAYFWASVASCDSVSLLASAGDQL